jgi:uncharacterized repeat protein (TIGR01451 family)
MSDAASPAVVRTASPASTGAAAAPADTLALPSTDLAIAVSAPAGPARVGEDLVYTVTVTNHGPVKATHLVVEQVMPEGAAFGGARTVGQATGGWGCTQHSGDRRVTCDTPTLPSGSSWTISFTMKPGAAVTIGTRFTVYAVEPDPQPENDSATIETAVAAGP